MFECQWRILFNANAQFAPQPGVLKLQRTEVVLKPLFSVVHNQHKTKVLQLFRTIVNTLFLFVAASAAAQQAPRHNVHLLDYQLDHLPRRCAWSYTKLENRRRCSYLGNQNRKKTILMGKCENTLFQF